MRHKVLMVLFIAGFVAGSAVFGAAGQDKKGSGNEEYIGSEGCKKCHLAEYDSWKLTYHSKMVRKREEGILKDVVETWKTDGINPGPTIANGTGKTVGVSDVVYVIGSNWKQRFLVKNDGHAMGATCHSTGYRLLEYDPANPKAQKATWVELNNGCENCHGPGGKHAKSKSGKDIWNFTGKSKAEQSQACAYCH